MKDFFLLFCLYLSVLGLLEALKIEKAPSGQNPPGPLLVAKDGDHLGVNFRIQ